jgi:hypothetical protein
LTARNNLFIADAQLLGENAPAADKKRALDEFGAYLLEASHRISEADEKMRIHFQRGFDAFETVLLEANVDAESPENVRNFRQSLQAAVETVTNFSDSMMTTYKSIEHIPRLTKQLNTGKRSLLSSMGKVHETSLVLVNRLRDYLTFVS